MSVVDRHLLAELERTAAALGDVLDMEPGRRLQDQLELVGKARVQLNAAHTLLVRATLIADRGEEPRRGISERKAAA